MVLGWERSIFLVSCEGLGLWQRRTALRHFVLIGVVDDLSDLLIAVLIVVGGNGEEYEGEGEGPGEELAEETLDSEPEPQVTLGSQPESQIESNLEYIQNAQEEKSAELILEPQEELLEKRILPLTLLGNESKVKKKELEHCKCSYDGTT